MNYEWNKKAEQGQKAIGYIEIFETNANNIDIRAIINYFPQLDQFGKNKICSVTFMYTCSKKEITDGFFHWINDDVIELIQEQENVKFEKSSEKFEIMMTQHFFVKKLPHMEYFTHGEYSISN